LVAQFAIGFHSLVCAIDFTLLRSKLRRLSFGERASFYALTNPSPLPDLTAITAVFGLSSLKEKYNQTKALKLVGIL